MIYRIITNGQKFKVEKKSRLSWKVETKECSDCRGESWIEEYIFNTEEEAEKYIESKRTIVWRPLKEISIDE